MDKRSGTILAAACGKGGEHDFRWFKCSKPQVRPDTELLGDSGFQGLAKPHAKSRPTHQRWRKALTLTTEQKAFDHALASKWVLVENVIRRLIVFRVLKETYRHRRRRHG